MQDLVKKAVGISAAYVSLICKLAMTIFSHTRMHRVRSIVFVAIACSVVCQHLSAQGGCLDSPEAPTDVLMGVGVAGMFYGSSIAMKVIRRIRGR
jgi:XrtJ-associated TM-motif-TM protein